MTDSAILEHLATKIMGWEIRVTAFGVVTAADADGSRVRLTEGGLLRRWNPLESIADAFEVQAAVPEDRQVRFLEALEDLLPSGFSDWDLVSATARQRCLAAVEATR